MGGPCFVFLYEQIPARGALIALDLTRCAQVEAASSSLPATFQKENTILTDGVSFCDCPQVLLSALPPTARKGECEGGTFDGFPHSRSITRPQATDFAQQNRRSKKIRPPFGWSYFFGAGDEARTRYLDLGKVALYQMSYARKRKVDYSRKHAACQPCIFAFCKNASGAAWATA